MPKNGDIELRQIWIQKNKEFEKAESEFWRAKAIEKKAYKEYMRTTECVDCGSKPGNNVCGEADRLVFACENYVGDRAT